MVIANRAYNPKNIQADIDLLENTPGDTTSSVCMA
jgi:hypothetical protein